MKITKENEDTKKCVGLSHVFFCIYCEHMFRKSKSYGKIR